MVTRKYRNSPHLPKLALLRIIRKSVAQSNAVLGVKNCNPMNKMSSHPSISGRYGKVISCGGMPTSKWRGNDAKKITIWQHWGNS